MTQNTSCSYVKLCTPEKTEYEKSSGQFLGLIVMSHQLARFEFKSGTFR
jgi:hypothetical protein